MMLRNLPATWDHETDVVAIGSGGGGLTAAITAHEHGARAMVLERSDTVGGVTAYSMGEVWIPGNHHEQAAGIADSTDSGLRYVKRLSMDYGDDTAMLNQAIHGPVALKFFEERAGLRMRVIRNFADYYFPHIADSRGEGRYLEVEPFPATSLGEWQSKSRLSPHVPYGLLHADIFREGGLSAIKNWDYALMAQRLEQDERCLGPGLAGYFLKAVLDRGIPLLAGIKAEELICDGERVCGVRAVQAGRDVFIKARRGVVIAVSGYERHKDYSKTLGHMLDPVSMVWPAIDGAHLRLAGPVGARIARVPDLTMLGIQTPGEEHEGGDPLWHGALPFLGLPHTIVVNRAGKRFGNESFYRAIFWALDIIDGGTQTHPNYPCWVILDSQAREKYPLCTLMPGQEWPEGMGERADTLAELAHRIGVDANGLAATVAAFNGYSERGVDPEFNRGTHPWGAHMCGDPGNKPNANLGPLTRPPYYAVALRRMGGGGIGATGILADQHCRAIGWNDRPIDGLYVAGNSVARLDTGALMQSGLSNARGMTHGYLAGRHAAGKPSDLLGKALARN